GATRSALGETRTRNFRLRRPASLPTGPRGRTTGRNRTASPGFGDPGRIRARWRGTPGRTRTFPPEFVARGHVLVQGRFPDRGRRESNPNPHRHGVPASAPPWSYDGEVETKGVEPSSPHVRERHIPVGRRPHGRCARRESNPRSPGCRPGDLAADLRARGGASRSRTGIPGVPGRDLPLGRWPLNMAVPTGIEPPSTLLAKHVA